MASPTVTYTLTNGSTADASQVQQNFNDLISALSDGSKSLSIDALTVGGALAANGAVTLGNATSDDVTITGYQASNLIPKSHAAYALGGSSNMYSSVYGVTHYATTVAEASSTVGVTVDGVLCKDGGITLVSGACAMTNYETGTFTVYVVDGSAVSTGTTARYVVVGKKASIYFQETVLSSTTTSLKLSSTSSAASPTWPAALTPANLNYGNYNRSHGGSIAQALLGFAAAGSATLYYDLAGSGFPASAVAKGLFVGNVNYQLT